MKTEVQLEELKNIKIEDYTYGLPEERIAKFPLEQREASQLLVYQEGRIDRKYFTDVGELLKPGQTLIFNNTKVIHARIVWNRSIRLIMHKVLHPGVNVPGVVW